MKNYMFLFLAAFAVTAIVSFTGCKEDDHSHDNDPQTPHNPVVTVTHPVNGDMYHNGDTVQMNIHMEDEDDLHEGYLDLYSATDTLFSFEPHVHEFHAYDLDTFWVVNGIAANTNVVFTTIALNHVGGGDTVNVNLVLQP